MRSFQCTSDFNPSILSYQVCPLLIDYPFPILLSSLETLSLSQLENNCWQIETAGQKLAAEKKDEGCVIRTDSVVCNV